MSAALKRKLPCNKLMAPIATTSPIAPEIGCSPDQLTWGTGCSRDEPAAFVVTVLAATIGRARVARRAGTALVLRALENIVKVCQLLLRC